MVFFKTREGALIPFTAPLSVNLYRSSYSDEPLTHRRGRITCGGAVVYEYTTNRDRDLTAMFSTLCTYVYEAIENAIEDGEINIILKIHDWEEDLI